MRFTLICPSCPFQNLSFDQKYTLFFQFARFCTPKRCTPARGGTSIETLYGDVPPKWVGF